MIEMRDTDESVANSNRWLVVIISVAFAVSATFWHFGAAGRGKIAGMFVCVSMYLIRSKWNLRPHLWFWVIASLVSTVHIALIFGIQWSNRSYPTVALLPAAIVDWAVWYSVVRLGENFM